MRFIGRLGGASHETIGADLVVEGTEISSAHVAECLIKFFPSGRLFDFEDEVAEGLAMNIDGEEDASHIAFGFDDGSAFDFQLLETSALL